MTDAPPLHLLLAELAAGRDWFRARLPDRATALPPPDASHPLVMTIPGFCAGDRSMGAMRRALAERGYQAHGWGQGGNWGARADTLDRIGARIAALRGGAHVRVHLVGWSLGGIYAREYAKRFPDEVASVITLGTPFSGSRRANHGWRAYRLIAGHSVDNPPIAMLDTPKPPVPTFALWSARDGVVAPPCAMGRDDERDHALELDCRHLGFAYDMGSVAAVIQCLEMVGDGAFKALHRAD